MFECKHGAILYGAKCLNCEREVDQSVASPYTGGMTIYQKAADRREQILQAACELAEETHYSKVRRHHLVERCDTAAGNVSRVMGSMEEMRTRLIQYALEHDRNTVVAQAIIDKHPAVSHLDTDRRGQILAAMA